MKAYLFDLDGTLAANEVLKGLALSHACASYGANADHAIYAEVMGQDWPTVTGHFFVTYGINPDAAEFNERFRAHYLHLIDAQIEETVGAKAFVLQSQARGVKLGLVSSAAAWMVEKIVKKLNFEGLFEFIITQKDVRHHKPHPEAYQLALTRLNLHPDEVLVFEDSHAGLQAAAAAGCQCIAIRHAFNVKHDLSQARQTIISFADIISRVP
jgi:HAD superfamily hydrolase (TIGR01509 family)